MPTIIEELTMTLGFDPKGFEEGAKRADTAASDLLQKILASLQQIEQRTAQTAANTTRIQKTAAEQAQEAADKTASAQESAANKAAKAQEDAAKKAAKDQEDASKRAGQAQKQAADQASEAYHKTANAIRRVGTEMLAMLGISLTLNAVERLFSGINKANVEAGYLARNIGMNVEQLTMWENIAGRLGGTSQGVASAFAYVSQQQAKIKYEGTSELVPAVRDLFGEEVRGPDHKLLQGDELVEALRRGAKRKGMSATDIEYATQRAGVGGLAPLVQASDEDYERAKRLRRESGNFTTAADAKAAKELSNDLDELTQKAMGLAREFWRGLGPAINDVVKSISQWIDKNKDWLTEKAIEWGRKLGTAIMSLSQDFRTLMEGGHVGGFIGKVIELGKAADATAQFFGGWGASFKLLLELWTVGKIVQMIANMTTVLGLAKNLALVPLTGLLARALGLAGAEAAAGAAVAGAAGGAATISVTPIILAAAATAAAAYAAFKSGSEIANAGELGFQVSQMDPLTGTAATEYTKGGKTYSVFEVQKEIAAHLAQLEAAAEATKAAKEQAEAAAKLQAAADAQTKAATSGTGTGAGVGAGGGGGGGIAGGGAATSSGAGGGASTPRRPADADAGTTSTDLSGGVGATQEQTNAFRGVLGLRESGGRYGIMGGSSGRFAGKYQMGRGEINETAKRLGEEPPSTEAFLHSPEMQERYFANYTLDHHKRLMKDPIYAKMSPEDQLAQLATAHLKGVGGALAQLHGGSAGVDAFKTSGASYRDMIAKEMTRLRHSAPTTQMASNDPPPPTTAPQPIPPRPTPTMTPDGDRWDYAPSALPAALKAPLVASPAAVATLTPPGGQAAPTTTLAGSNAARRDDWATKMPEPVGASTAAQGFQMSSNDNSSSSTDQSNTTHIGALHVHSSAQDAASIATDIHREIRKFDYAAHADTGLA
jgi:hypothetical protein